METIYHHFPVLDSTNNCAKRNAHLLDKTSLTVIYTDEQKSGRGRFSHRWLSPPRYNLYASYCFFVEELSSKYTNLSQVLSLSVAALLKEHGFTPQCKWPNDLLISGKKIAGILIETTQVDEGWVVICGIGLNVNMPPELLKELKVPATSMMVEGGGDYEVETVLESLTDQIIRHLDLFKREGFAPFLDDYRNLTSYALDKEIVFCDPLGNQIHGSFTEVNEEGALVLALPSGEKKVLTSGKVAPAVGSYQ